MNEETRKAITENLVIVIQNKLKELQKSCDSRDSCTLRDLIETLLRLEETT